MPNIVTMGQEQKFDDAEKGLMDCKGYDLYPDGTMRPAHGLGEWVRAEDYDRLHAAAEAAQAEITALRDAEPVAWEYWREVGISEEERIVTKQPPELMQQVELYQYRPLYALPAAAIEQRDKALEEAAKVCDRLRNKNYSSEDERWVAGTDDCAAAIRAMKECGK